MFQEQISGTGTIPQTLRQNGMDVAKFLKALQEAARKVNKQLDGEGKLENSRTAHVVELIIQEAIDEFEEECECDGSCE